jgi:uncharacterized BrkB/YihY/UPF0761 family membrane protein
MKNKLFNHLLLFSLFGIALGFFGILYEGSVYGPKMLGDSKIRMLFWKEFYTVISPLVYYIPLVPLATVILIILYFNTPKENVELKSRLKIGGLFQIGSLILTLYIIKQLNLKLYFSNIGKYSSDIPAKAILFNILSVCRIALTIVALIAVFRAYIQYQKDKLWLDQPKK